MEIIMQSFSWRVALAGAALLAANAAFPSVSHADSFTFTSCHVSMSACEGGTVPSGFGTVTLTQSGNNVNFDVVLAGTLRGGNNFAKTGSAGGFLFLSNDTVSGSTVASGATVTRNGVDVTAPAVPGASRESPTKIPPQIRRSWPTAPGLSP